ncbi:MAG: LytR/AlgR family response regulator transcription factor [Tsuneonella suprasediminis]|uniref:DNA-binding response regulator n=1 Tax=Tsuneonella suprasediminis TaxID=2306996 RepID=A0A419QXT3_9SPHN|nr:LytTR family DNA-binding domain-containing protein [Tsuneonella suprasediminis]RJX65481.1 DNA-binding response regulator [Tsuneonella suprasediminis]UBS33704.1 LytTR family DNA-binding domain-containing protein [Altererythrobacter sp. N1]
MPDSAAERPKMRTLIVDDEPLAVERMQVICARMDGLSVVGTASDGAAALRLIGALSPDLVLLDMTMPEVDGLAVARKLAKQDNRPAVIFVTAHDHFAVEAFDLDAVDYVLKPVTPERLGRAIERADSRRSTVERAESQWLDELWVPHRSELLRIEVAQVARIDAERDYVRLHVEDRSYLLLQTIAGLEARLDPAEFIRIHRSTILRRDRIRGLRHDGLGVWSVELEDGDAMRIGRTYLPRVKAMAGR